MEGSYDGTMFQKVGRERRIRIRRIRRRWVATEESKQGWTSGSRAGRVHTDRQTYIEHGLITYRHA